LLYSLPTTEEAGFREFAGLFLHGNALMAIGSMIRFYYAKEEADVVAATQQLASARSPLTVEELTGLLDDPRFYVRFEAIVSMTRHSTDARLTQALIEVLQAPDPALGTMAAWALARYGNAASVPALRKALETTPYRSIQIHVCRALASMNDQSIVPWLKEHVESTDWGVRLAAASGLGKLKVFDATPQLLQVLYMSPPQSHKEAALALARLLGAEVPYIQLTRTLEEDAATGLAQQMDTLRTRLPRSSPGRHEVAKQLVKARDLFARQMWEAAFGPFLKAATLMTASETPSMCQQMLIECATRIHEFGRERLEYLIIALLVMERCGSRQQAQ
jgi:hypothetical protein